MTDGRRRLSGAGASDAGGAAVLALLVAGGAVWGVHQVLPQYWASGQIDLLGWLAFTLRNVTDPITVDAAWFRLWQAEYHHYLAALAAVGLATGGLVFALITRRALLWGLPALAIGGLAGVLGGAVGLPRVPDLPMLALVFGPALGTVLFGALGLALVPPKTRDGLVRGARVASGRPARASRSAVRRAVRKGRIAFAGTVLSPAAESTHVLAIGASGSGKSTAIGDLLETGIARGGAMVVADPGGEAMEWHWRDGDRVLNPFDPACAKWDLFADLREDTDDDRVATALLPASGGADAQRWTQRGRDLLATLMRRYRRLGAGGSDDFAHFLSTADDALLAELVAGTEAASLFTPGNDRLRGSVIDELAPAKRLLNRMAAVEGAPFSIRDWVRANEGGGGRLWLPYRLDQLDSLRAAIGCWMGLAAMEVMALGRSKTRRVWFVADELDMLGRVPDLAVGLTNGRRHGACFALGFQSIAQLRETYGPNVAAVIEEQIGTKLVLRADGFGPEGTAEYASKLIGEREVEREEVSVSRKPGLGRRGSTSHAMRQRTERAVMPAEIAQLPDLVGYLRPAGRGEWRMVRLAPRRD